MEIAKVIDYASPTMAAEKALKNMHYAMLERKYDEALEHALEAMTQTRLAYNAIRHEKEK